MRTLEELKIMLLEISKSNNYSLSNNVRDMFDLKLITYSECIVLREFVLDSNL